jgi:magnesium transporter
MSATRSAAAEQSDGAAERPTARRRLVCLVDGVFRHDVEPGDISELIRRDNDFLWFDLHNPHEDDIALLREEFDFHPLAIEDIVRQHQRPKIDAYDGYYFLVVYALHYDEASSNIHTHPLHLFIGTNYIVSVHSGAIHIIDETMRRWERHQDEIGRGGGAVLYHVLDAIIDEYFPVIDRIAERIEDIEEQIFERFDPAALQEILRLKRELLMIRRVAAPERDVLNVLIRREVPIFDQSTIQYMQDVYDHIIRITDSIDTYRDLLSSTLDAYLSVQSNQLNQVVKVLTIASIVLMTNALIAGIYGMNFEFMPELSWPFGYPLALGLMALLTLALIFLFRRLRWL